MERLGQIEFKELPCFSLQQPGLSHRQAVHSFCLRVVSKLEKLTTRNCQVSETRRDGHDERLTASAFKDVCCLEATEKIPKGIRKLCFVQQDLE